MHPVEVSGRERLVNPPHRFDRRDTDGVDATSYNLVPRWRLVSHLPQVGSL